MISDYIKSMFRHVGEGTASGALRVPNLHQVNCFYSLTFEHP